MDTDEALFERLVGGDMTAFDPLYERYERPLFGFIRAQLAGDAAEAEDVLHETFMAVLRERHKRSEMRSLRAWLYQVARNLCLNRARSRKRATRAAETAESLALGATERGEVESALETQQRAEQLARALSKLPQPLAEVYRLRASGMSYEELAAALEVPVGTVKSRMHEMVKRLREEMYP